MSVLHGPNSANLVIGQADMESYTVLEQVSKGINGY
jgi:hypothetical protein